MKMSSKTPVKGSMKKTSTKQGVAAKGTPAMQMKKMGKSSCK